MREEYEPCPLCRQYSHSIGDDAVAKAFRHFEAMLSHRGDGIPTQHAFDHETRDAAQVLTTAIETLSRENRELREALERIKAFEDGERMADECWDEIMEIARTTLGKERGMK